MGEGGRGKDVGASNAALLTWRETESEMRDTALSDRVRQVLSRRGRRLHRAREVQWRGNQRLSVDRPHSGSMLPCPPPPPCACPCHLRFSLHLRCVILSSSSILRVPLSRSRCMRPAMAMQRCWGWRCCHDDEDHRGLALQCRGRGWARRRERGREGLDYTREDEAEHALCVTLS